MSLSCGLRPLTLNIPIAATVIPSRATLPATVASFSSPISVFSAKQTLDGGQEVFVQSLSSGRPVPAVAVTVVGRNGLPVATGHTDDQGHVRFAQLNDLRREKSPIMVMASLERDLSFLPLGHDEHQIDFSRFDIGGRSNQRSPNQVSASLFTDRGLYRPGETAHIGYILRANDWQLSLAGMPIEIEITDPRGLRRLPRTQGHDRRRL